MRWAFWVPAERMEEFGTVFDQRVAPILAEHGFVDGQPDTRTIPDSIFTRVYRVESRDDFEARQNAVQQDSRWPPLLRDLGDRYGSASHDGDLLAQAMPYREPAGLGRKYRLPPPTVTPVGPGRGHWRTYGVPDGLPSLDLVELFQDRDGYIWICTFGSGLSRWDGERFESFTVEDGTGGLAPRHVMQTRDGDVWITFMGGLVSRWDGERFETFDLVAEAGIPNWGWAVSSYEDSRGWVWFSAIHAGLVLYDGERFRRFTTDDGLAGSPGHWKSILEDSRGRMWFGTLGGISTWDGKGRVTFETVGPEIPARHFMEDRGGTLWVTARPHVARLSDGEWELLTRDGGPLPFDEHDWVHDIMEAHDGTIWVLTGAVLRRFDGSAWSLVQPEDTDWYPLRRILQDDDGTLWIAGMDGLRRWDGVSMRHYTMRDGLDNNTIRAAEIDASGDLWLGTIGNLSRFDARRFVTFTKEDGLANDVTHGRPTRDRDGNLWFLSVEGLTRYDGETFAAWTRQDSIALFHQDSQSFEDEDGSLWVSGARVHHLRGDSITVYDEGDGLLASYVSGTWRDEDGHLWFGNPEGVSRLSSGVFEHFTQADGLEWGGVRGRLVDRMGREWLLQTLRLTAYENGRFYEPEAYAELGAVPAARRRSGYTIRDGYRDRDGNLWLATESRGVYRWDGRHMAHFTTAEGLAHDAIRGIGQSSDGHLWFSTDGGVVSRYDGRVFQTLSRDDGLNGQSIRGMVQAADGDMWFTTYGGVTRYRQPPSSPPEMSVDAVIAGRRVADPSEVVVPSSVDLVQIEYHGRSLTTPARGLVYTYRLRGLDDEWRQTRERTLEFQNLPVGDYTLEIQAVDRDLVYSDTARVNLEVVYQPTLSSVSIDSVHVDDLFASTYRDYVDQPFGSVLLTNNDADTMAVSLSFQLIDWMRRPGRQEVRLKPGQSRRVSISAAMDDEILSLRQSGPFPARVAVSFAVGGDTVSVQRSIDVTVYKRGAVRWNDGVGPAASFITPADEGVAAFASEPLRHFADKARALGRPAANLTQAMVLFETLRAHGVRYQVDASEAYVAGRAGGVVDHIQYPAQTLASRTGDCDDLTVLYASLLESAGIATALVDYPEHLFLLVDTGLSRWEAYRLPLLDRLTVVHGDRVWIPVEITRLDAPFERAWHDGADEMAKLSGVERRQRILLTADAWARHSPAVPSVAGTPPPAPTATADAVASGQSALRERIDEQIERRYLQPLRGDEAGNDALRTRLLQVYVALADYDAAIAAALDFLIDERGDGAATHNHLGIAYFLKGETRQATYHFRQALAVRPDDEGIEHNLEHALWTLGRRDSPSESDLVADATASESRGAASGGAEHAFYWID